MKAAFLRNAAAAACPPKDTNSCSLAIIASILFTARSLVCLSLPKVTEKSSKKSKQLLMKVELHNSNNRLHENDYLEVQVDLN